MKISRSMGRGAFLLPTLLTTANLVMGCLVISFLLDQAEEAALTCSVLILVAVALDSCDGLIARATGTSSKLGMELDSMADVMSFGAAPAWLAYVYCLRNLWSVGLVACVWYVFCAAFRLARFNAQVENQIKGFSGLPSPAAAATVASFVIMLEAVPRLSFLHFMPAQDYLLYRIAPAMAAGLAGLGWLMISRTPYLSLKGFDISRPRPVRLVVAIIVLVFVIWSLPQLLFALLLLYVFTGLVGRFLIRVPWGEIVAPTWVEKAEAIMAGSIPPSRGARTRTRTRTRTPRGK